MTGRRKDSCGHFPSRRLLQSRKIQSSFPGREACSFCRSKSSGSLLRSNRAVYSGRASLLGVAQPRYMALGIPQILAAPPDIEAARHQEAPEH